jgi:transcriptional regulator with XRE-family HTH domain
LTVIITNRQIPVNHKLPIDKECKMPAKNEAMGKRIRRLRGNQTLEEFAKLIGVTAPAIQRYESGRMPRSDILVRIAKIGRQPVEWLLHGEDVESTGIVSESSIPYGGLGRNGRQLLKEVEALIKEGDTEITTHLRQQVALLRKLKKSQAEKA